MWATREACRSVAAPDLDYGDPRGSTVLREVLAAYLRRVRAAAAAPDRIVVCTGFAQGLNLVLRALTQLGVRRAALEDPGHGDLAASDSARAARVAGMDVVHVPVDELGLDVAALEASGARVVVVTPAHQSPTGVVLAANRRHALVEWASRNDGFIIEDDYDSEFRYDREPVGVLQGLAPDRVFAIGTVSKSLAPAVRLGWVLVPPPLSDAIAAEKRANDRGSSGLDQLAVAALLESGRYDRHLRRMRAVWRADRLPGQACRRGQADRAGGRVPRCGASAGIGRRAGSRHRRAPALGRPVRDGPAAGGYRSGTAAARARLRERQRARGRVGHRRGRGPAALNGRE